MWATVSSLVLSIRNFTTIPVIFVIISQCCVNLQFFWIKKGLGQRFYAIIFQDFNRVKFNVVKSEHCSVFGKFCSCSLFFFSQFVSYRFLRNHFLILLPFGFYFWYRTKEYAFLIKTVLEHATM